uniref:Uncharacterized protein n=1 Tax=Aegilops tauschii subsp. strangulata TaxID=200361 RepID=A0A453KQU6_AEGTS
MNTHIMNLLNDLKATYSHINLCHRCFLTYRVILVFEPGLTHSVSKYIIPIESFGVSLTEEMVSPKSMVNAILGNIGLPDANQTRTTRTTVDVWVQSSFSGRSWRIVELVILPLLHLTLSN